MTNSVPAIGAPRDRIWQRGVGQGFQDGSHSAGFYLAADYGLKAFGSEQAHQLTWAGLSCGRMISGAQGEGHWYRGNFEVLVELFAGAQYDPESEWLVGLTPHLRYNFATGTRFVPFIDGGAGVTATGIGPPDLSNTFEFNLQGGPGVHWFFKDNAAVTVQARYLHMSCAGISSPNKGLNSVMGLVGLTWFF